MDSGFSRRESAMRSRSWPSVHRAPVPASGGPRSPTGLPPLSGTAWHNVQLESRLQTTSRPRTASPEGASGVAMAPASTRYAATGSAAGTGPALAHANAANNAAGLQRMRRLLDQPEAVILQRQRADAPAAGGKKALHSGAQRRHAGRPCRPKTAAGTTRPRLGMAERIIRSRGSGLLHPPFLMVISPNTRGQAVVTRSRLRLRAVRVGDMTRIRRYHHAMDLETLPLHDTSTTAAAKVP